MYRTVIVPLDGSERAEAAVPVAASFARRAMAELDLVTVPDADGADLTYLEKVAADATAQIGLLVARGAAEPAASIVTHAANRPDPVICMTTHARGVVGELVLGSVAEAVVRDSGLPVVLVGPHVPPDAVPTFDVMVACLDGSSLSEAVLPVVRAWHDTIGTRPWLVQVQDPAMASMTLASRGDVLETAYLRRVAAELQKTGTEADYDVLHARDTAEAIARFAEGLPASVIALATHGRAGVSRTVLGSVAMRVVHRAACPVLVIRPERGAVA